MIVECVDLFFFRINCKFFMNVKFSDGYEYDISQASVIFNDTYSDELEDFLSGAYDANINNLSDYVLYDPDLWIEGIHICFMHVGCDFYACFNHPNGATQIINRNTLIFCNSNIASLQKFIDGDYDGAIMQHPSKVLYDPPGA